MLLLWILLGVSVLTAGIALARTRRLSKRLDRDRESYWDLRYEFGQLQARVTRLEEDRTAAPPPSRPGGADAFVPLSSLKR